MSVETSAMINDRLIMRSLQTLDEDGEAITPDSFAKLFARELVHLADQPRAGRLRRGFWTTEEFTDALEEVMIDLLENWNTLDLGLTEEAVEAEMEEFHSSLPRNREV